MLELCQHRPLLLETERRVITCLAAGKHDFCRDRGARPGIDGLEDAAHLQRAEDDQHDSGGRIKLVAVECGVQCRANAAGADDANHCGLAKVDVEAVEAKPDHARHHLRLDTIIDPLQPAGTGRAYGFCRRRIHVLDVLGEEFAVKPNGGERQRDNAGEGPEAKQLDEEDCQDDFLETARYGEDAAAEVIDQAWRDVLCSTDPDRNRNRDTDHSGGHGHPQTFKNAFRDVAPAAGEVGRKERREESRAARKAVPNAHPVDDSAKGQGPAQPGTLDQRRLFPMARGDCTNCHMYQPSRATTSAQPCGRDAAGGFPAK